LCPKKKLHTAVAKLTSELNISLEDLVSTKIVRREFHKSNIQGRAATATPLTIENNAKNEKGGVIIIKPGRLMIENMYYGQMSCSSLCSQHQVGFMLGKRQGSL
jgi:hypothetical protein